ncbi:Gfo/Idh/MocA family oxidoreductase [Mucilaginibacter pallidiroseus]|uniref:Gfo/Idh/MocA family oxidoreductase n=1 Tax=Mucilaginibacter pallidiroseus TaxID=2599295 RepID=A0A563UJY1_9SPHI|nr:Gfo/Idh/MocA family oxidoreductase [Mucilaginibacter pallidiroseus]TWR31579.1 Gfo/Idh/MocA family oxidoreductase [Mucilaginibacter pallidiroseus]
MKAVRFLICLIFVTGLFKSIAFSQQTPVKTAPATTAAAVAVLPPAPALLSTLKLGIAGLSHDHVHNILNDYKAGKVVIVGIAEADKQLRDRYQQQYQLPDSLFFDDLKKLAVTKKPDAVLGFNPVAKHIDVVETCAPLGISVMVEKPLAATLAQARRMEFLALKYYVKVLTNYETTWYPSYQYVYNMTSKDSIGQIRKMVVHDGHEGPKEIGCSKEFVSWLTDPELNGGGALIDFGCYGADLMTWLMNGQKPIAVTAIAKHYKPQTYPKVEDDVNILVEYPTATGIIEASWNWPFSIKDLEVFGDEGYMHAVDPNYVYTRAGKKNTGGNAPPLEANQNHPISYLQRVLQNRLLGLTDRSSLKYNIIVMQILDASKRSIAEGKRIAL